MGKTSFHEFKRQASFFFKAKIKAARLALTDVTPAQLLTEEVTNGNPWPPHKQNIRIITRAAFEVDDFCRIVHILHKSLLKFKSRDWRAWHNTLILLEHVLTNGPNSFAEEFEEDGDILQVLNKIIDTFQFVDDKGFNWGMSVRNLTERVLKLLEDKPFLKEERRKARNNLAGSLSQPSFPVMDYSYPRRYHRCNSECNDQKTSDRKDNFFSEIYLIDKGESEKSVEENESMKGRSDMELDSQSRSRVSQEGEKIRIEIDHPFCEFNHQTKESLLSSVE